MNRQPSLSRLSPFMQKIGRQRSSGLEAGSPSGISSDTEAKVRFRKRDRVDGSLRYGERYKMGLGRLPLVLPIVGPELAGTGGEEVDAGLDVTFIRHFDDLMDVSGGDRDGTCDGASGGHSLEAGGVCAAG